MIMGDEFSQSPTKVAFAERDESIQALPLSPNGQIVLHVHWREPSIAPSTSGAPQTFRVTHPFHPLRGRVFQLIECRQTWGEYRVFFHDDAGYLARLPRQWTDLISDDPTVIVGVGRAHFRYDDLCRLIDLLTGLAERPRVACSGGVYGALTRSGSRRTLVFVYKPAQPVAPFHSHRSRTRPTLDRWPTIWTLGDRPQPVRFLIRDHDRKFTDSFDAVFEAQGTRIVQTPIQVPEANGIAERFVRTVRSECLDWLLIVSGQHLERALTVFIGHYNGHRAHRSLELAPPTQYDDLKLFELSRPEQQEEKLQNALKRDAKDRQNHGASE
jgi:Family of unknown function (DUF5372)/Integrase core domain